MNELPKQKIAITFVLEGYIIGNDEMTLKRAIDALKDKFKAVQVSEAHLIRIDKYEN